jgi:hypothetical protein
MIIKLNEAEQKLALYLAKARYDENRLKGNPDPKLSLTSNKEIELDGVVGELAVCRMFNVYPDTETKYDEYPKYDLLTHKGSKVDVKTTQYKNGRLLATLNKKVCDVDIYVLVIGSFPVYDVVGWAKSEELIADQNIMNLGRGDGYALSQDQLRAFK